MGADLHVQSRKSSLRALLPSLRFPTPARARKWLRGYRTEHVQLAFQASPGPPTWACWTPHTCTGDGGGLPPPPQPLHPPRSRPAQLLVSYAALFAIFSPAPVWDALSYANVASPAIILFLLPIFQPANGERASPSCPPDAPAPDGLQ